MSISVDIEKNLGSFQLKASFSGGDEVIALLGASGCGKSMTLKCIAGIERPDRGRIVVDGRTLFDSEKKINLSAQQRHTGLLFQNYALFPNMTVLQNISAGAKREKDAAKRERLTSEIIEGFGLSELVKRYPHQLSGGQQQRVALARILVSDPDVLLLDEPFSALDSHLRFRLEQEVREIIARFGKTVVLVSHDRDEVFRLCDRIAVMHDGAIETCGARDEVFARPGTVNAAIITGCKNISRIERISEKRVRALDWDMELETQGGNEAARYIGIRMHDLQPEAGANSFRCEVVKEIENPFSYTLMLRPEGRSAAQSVGWETDKETWRRRRAGYITVNLPAESLVLLASGEAGEPERII
ncbi:MAG: ATP-binding cassette domain-containing protein [Oscillospiraceae bacterium]|nr:ATP-binding cassette domain-containing protein [Oscillospiraceae bacterium]